jgi:hypothetical protein
MAAATALEFKDVAGVSPLLNARGKVVTISGSGTRGSVDGLGKSASWHSPMGLVAVGTTLYVADPGSDLIRSVNMETGDTLTIAGFADLPGHKNGYIRTSQFTNPSDLCVDPKDPDTKYLTGHQSDVLCRSRLIAFCFTLDDHSIRKITPGLNTPSR